MQGFYAFVLLTFFLAEACMTSRSVERKIMALKFKYSAKEQVPAEHLGLYVERDGAFLLDAEGAVEKSKLDEFRSNNLALKKQLDDLAAKYEGIDPDAVKTLLAEKAKLEEQKL